MTTGWNEAVQHWRALVTELRAELVCDRPICDRVVGSIASRCPALTRLDLSSSVVTVASVQQLSLHCPRLRWLSIRASCHSSLSDDIILALVGCTALEHLDLSNIRGLLAPSHTGRLKQIARLSVRAPTITTPTKHNLSLIHISEPTRPY